MFNLNYSEPCKIEGTIRMKKPVYRLGPLTDVDGNVWDVRGILGSVIQAVPHHHLHPFYSDTSGADHGFVSQTWKPYQTEIVE